MRPITASLDIGRCASAPPASSTASTHTADLQICKRTGRETVGGCQLRESACWQPIQASFLGHALNEEHLRMMTR